MHDEMARSCSPAFIDQPKMLLGLGKPLFVSIPDITFYPLQSLREIIATSPTLSFSC